MKERKIALIVMAVLVLALMPVPVAVFAGTTSSGSLVVGNAAPTITLGSLYDSTDVSNENNTLLDVWVEYHINYSLADTNTLYDLASSYVTVWETYGNTVSSADANATHYTFKYDNTTDAWSEIGPGPADAHLISGNCVKPADRSLTTGSYKLAFKLDYVANYTQTTKSWNARVNVTDSAANTAANTSIIFGINFYSSANVVDTAHQWAGASPGDNNLTLTTPADAKIDITVTANGVWDLQGKGSADLSDGLGHTVALANIMMHYDTLASAAALTNGYLDVIGATGNAAGANVATQVKLWATVPGGQASGTYTYTFSVQVVAG